MTEHKIPNTIGTVAECIENKKGKPVSTHLGAMHNIMQGNCPTCSKRVLGFRDELSKKEYVISGMCQECQDSVFGE